MRARKPNTRSIAIAMLLLLVSLGTVGMAYAQWRDRLAVAGSVETGTLDAQWVQVGPCSEIDPAGVGLYSWQIVADDEGHDKDKVTFSIVNGYPGYSAGCTVKFKNTSTLQWRIVDYGVEAGPNLTACSWSGGYPSSPITMTCKQLQVEWTDGAGSLTIPGGQQSSSFEVAVLDGAEAGQEYGFTIEVFVSGP